MQQACRWPTYCAEAPDRCTLTDMDAAKETPSQVKRYLSRLPMSIGDAVVLGSLALVALSVLSIYWFSGFDLTTSLAILGVVDRTQVLLATVLSVAPPIIGVIVMLRGPGWVRRLFATGGSATEWATLGLVAGIGFPLMIFNTSLLVLGVLFLVPLLTARRHSAVSGFSRSLRFTTADHHVIRGVMIAATVSLLLAVSLGRPWTPREEVTVDSDSAPLVAYVIGAREGQHLFLIPRHGARWIAGDDIEKRRICAPRQVSWYLRSLHEAIGPKRYKPCD